MVHFTLPAQANTSLRARWSKQITYPHDRGRREGKLASAEKLDPQPTFERNWLESRISATHMWRMAYRVPQASVEAALNHLVRYGDTDIFPHLPELAFFADEAAAIVDELSKLDLDTYIP